MTEEIASLESPIDSMYLIHKALRAEATRAEEAADRLEVDVSLQRFKLAFNSWATALVYHADLEDKYIGGPLTNGQSAAQANSLSAAIMAMEDGLHRELVERVQDVLTLLNKEIRDQQVITRTKQHLYRQVVTLRITQEDHLETEEALVLPALRAQMDEQEQLKVARGLLIDEEAQDPRWIIDWVSQHLNGPERDMLSELEARFDEP
ncbi:MAG: hemerythrin domain-containing protein [Dehalococcoidia bacterium]